MTSDPPNYAAIEPPEGKDPAEYDYIERRAALFDAIVEAGSPRSINQAEQARKFGVARSTLNHDMDRVSESVSEYLADDVEVTTKAVFEHVLNDLLESNSWRAKKAAFELALEWSEWLVDRGELEQEPDRTEIDLNRTSDSEYQLVRRDEIDGDTLDDLDLEELGFAAWPGMNEDSDDETDSDLIDSPESDEDDHVQ